MQGSLLRKSVGAPDPFWATGDAVGRAEMLARVATFALVEEAKLTPKPGLVDQHGSGAHADMNLALMLCSAQCLEPMFADMALAAARRTLSPELREELAQLGRAGEARMLAITGGVNTHRGAIWTLGLLVASAAMGPGTEEELAQRAGRLARYTVPPLPGPMSHGSKIAQRYGFSGARGEAQAGFPHVMKCGLPALRDSRARFRVEAHARLDALLAIMAELDDTCLVYRGGLTVLEWVKAGARRIREHGGAGSPSGFEALLHLNDELIRRGASPGGSADLLAAVLFLDAIARSERPDLAWKS